MKNIKSIENDINNASDSDLTFFFLEVVNTNTTLIQKYLLFQLILLSRQKDSPVNYFENWIMSITQVHELVFNYFSFSF